MLEFLSKGFEQVKALLVGICIKNKSHGHPVAFIVDFLKFLFYSVHQLLDRFVQQSDQDRNTNQNKANVREYTGVFMQAF